MFGTMLDWRTSVAREAKVILEPLGHSLDWLAFADAWRAEYRPSMNEVIEGKMPFCKLDVLHRRSLVKILPLHGVTGLDGATIDHLNLCWHRLDAWPDVPAGHARLRRKYLVAPVSNGNISLMVDVARRNDLHWDAILGAETAGEFKMQPGVYRKACAALDLPPGECMMVAAHERDLAAAAAVGLRTAFIHRPNEFGPGKGGALPQAGAVDVIATSAEDLAAKLGL
jgi:2-haloacid dehalogenase